ncbi:MAG: DUF1080 domain-containing protein [Gemmataceae bacterium]|nr:DUF1080 domain-containing protein [Gemmataceae bacterium]
MRSLTPVLAVAAATLTAATAADPPGVVGRWDLTVSGPDGTYPSWLEVRRSGTNTLVGSFVGRFGSARPVSRVEVDGDRVRFAVPPQWEKRADDLAFEGKLDGGLLRGETTDDRGRRVTWEGRRAPDLKRAGPPRWGAPVGLFNGKDLTGWKPRPPAAGHGWAVENGVLVNKAPGTDLVTGQTFTDFKLRAEFRYPKGSNSGVYLRGRYEVQVEDDAGRDPDSHGSGGVYGFLTPSVNAAKPAGEWQTLEVTLVGRVLTVVLNGERVIDRQAIPGITGGALDGDEGRPGPVMLQGDHGRVEFRALTLTPAADGG